MQPGGAAVKFHTLMQDMSGDIFMQTQKLNTLSYAAFSSLERHHLTPKG